MNLLPINPDENTYHELFKQNEPWIKAILHLAKKYKLAGEPKRSARGSHIIFKVGHAWIKIMAPIFSKDMAFEIAGLKTVFRKTNISTPEIISHGDLESWKYIVLTDIHGQRVGDVWSHLNTKEKTNLAKQMANATLEMQKCAPDKGVYLRGDWNEFIKNRFKNATTHHKAKNMNQEWLLGLENFLSGFQPEDFMASSPVFLHADLTWDHFLISDIDSSPKVTGVIDFADCRVGHPEYDLPATTAFILKGETAPLKAYVQNLGIKNFDQRFSEKLLAWTCLHQYSNLNNYFTIEMSALTPGDYAGLAKMVYPLNT